MAASTNIATCRLAFAYISWLQDRDILVHCKVGGRSAEAVRLLMEHGYDDVRSLDGGVLAWVFFRAPDLGSAFQVFGRLFSGGGPSPLVTPTVLLAIFAGIAVQFVPQGFWPAVQLRFATLSLFSQAAWLAGLLILCNAIVGEQGVAPFIYFRF